MQWFSAIVPRPYPVTPGKPVEVFPALWALFVGLVRHRRHKVVDRFLEIYDTESKLFCYVHWQLGNIWDREVNCRDLSVRN